MPGKHQRMRTDNQDWLNLLRFLIFNSKIIGRNPLYLCGGYAIKILCEWDLYRKIDSILMNIMNRRTFLLNAATIPLALIVTEKATKSEQVVTPQANLAKLEKASGERLGVYTLNTENDTQIDHRVEERFPLCSTFKVIAASAILARSTQIDGLLQQRIHYKPGDLVSYSPITEKHISKGMTVSELCAAALQHSDNTAGNLLYQSSWGYV